MCLSLFCVAKKRNVIICFCQVILHAERLLSGGPCGGMHLSWEWGVDPALPHGSPHSFSSFPVACLSLVLRAAHTDLVRPLLFRSATLLAFFSCFQVIRRPAAPIEFCRPHAPTGLELDPFHYLEVISCTAQFAFRLTGDPEHATTLSCLQRLVVVACLLTLAFRCWGWGVGTKKNFAGLLCMPSVRPCGGMHLLSTGVGYRPGLTTRFAPLLFLWLAIPSSSERRTPT